MESSIVTERCEDRFLKEFFDVIHSFIDLFVFPVVSNLLFIISIAIFSSVIVFHFHEPIFRVPLFFFSIDSLQFYSFSVISYLDG